MSNNLCIHIAHIALYKVVIIAVVDPKLYMVLNKNVLQMQYYFIWVIIISILCVSACVGVHVGDCVTHHSRNTINYICTFVWMELYGYMLHYWSVNLKNYVGALLQNLAVIYTSMHV